MDGKTSIGWWLHRPAERRQMSDWTILASRLFFGHLEWFEVYLAAHRVGAGVGLAILGHRTLGQVPDGWYDEDGELLPMRRTESGVIRLPEVSAGHPVTGSQDGNFVGEWEPMLEGTKLIPANLTEVAVTSALIEIGWDPDIAPEVRAKLSTSA